MILSSRLEGSAEYNIATRSFKYFGRIETKVQMLNVYLFVCMFNTIGFSECYTNQLQSREATPKITPDLLLQSTSSIILYECGESLMILRPPASHGVSIDANLRALTFRITHPYFRRSFAQIHIYFEHQPLALDWDEIRWNYP